MIDIDQLRAALSYNPETGDLIWRCNRRGSSARVGAIAGYRKSTGYITVCVDGEHVYAHRIAWMLTHGPIQPRMEIDHVDHDPANNRLDNLRLVTAHGNKANQSRSSRNTSGVTGVYWARHAKAWAAQIKAHGMVRSLGYFKTVEAAAAARKTAEREHGFHPNHGASK